ncbi:hypothetical protein CPB86DRAFT_46831 [Serendipita vermifera]|nr:hypothetical protein CPB86DRAFT_46831 [Serendipita vermifera]
MTRARSGSFYCPVEPSLGPLSIAQKAAISTAPSTRSPPTSSSGTFAGKRRVELLLPSVEMIASSGIVQAGSSSSRHHHHRSLAVSSASSSLPSITNSLRNVIPFQRKDKVAMSPLALGACEVVAAAAARVAAGRHMYSPARPSPLRRLVNAPEPLCPSALWTSQRELLPLL